MSTYTKGKQITVPSTVIQLILDGNPLFRKDKQLTRKWLLQQTLHDLVYWTAMGEIFDAVVTEEED